MVDFNAFDQGVDLRRTSGGYLSHGIHEVVQVDRASPNSTGKFPAPPAATTRMWWCSGLGSRCGIGMGRRNARNHRCPALRWLVAIHPKLGAVPQEARNVESTKSKPFHRFEAPL